MNYTINYFLEQLKNLEEEGKIECDISYRGGYYKIPKTLAEELVGAEKYDLDCYLPSYVGAGCNYLGGGIRGSIFSTGDASVFIDNNVPYKYAIRLEKLCKAAMIRYEEIENEMGLNEIYNEEGERNFEAEGTMKARINGYISAY